jgi:hypothetical protein
MVASPGSVPTQNQLMHFQRVNVAMSRARDRCYLIHSIDSHHVSNGEDSKLLLLNFFQKETVETADIGIDSVGERDTYDKLISRLLEDRGYRVRKMGKVWSNAICVENESSDARASVLIDCVGEPAHEWAASYAQQRAIERVGWKCLRIDAVSFLHDFHGTLQKVVSFLSKAGIKEKMLLYDQLEVEEQDDEGVEGGNEDVEISGAVEIDLGDDEEDDKNPSDRDSDGDGENNALPILQPGAAVEEVFVISSDDEEETRKVNDSMDVDHVPDAVGSGLLDDNGDQAAEQFGEVVDPSFLRAGPMDLDQIEDFAVARGRSQEESQEWSYEADQSDMGDTSLSRAAKRRRYQRLDKYAKDPRWYPKRGTKADDDDGADWYDTDSDLGEDDQKMPGKPSPKNND